MPTICLDPGHQKGVDAGAQGNGLCEEDLTLNICKRIKPLLECNGFAVVMTREGDTVLGITTVNESLRKRVSIANSANADLFISVHINAFNGSAQGIQTFGSGSDSSMKLARIMQYYLAQQSQMSDRGVAIANFYVLLKTKMPAILTENGFIDNTEDASKLATEEFRQKLAIAHAKAVCDYYGQEYKDKVPDQTVQPDKVQRAVALLEQCLKILKG